MVLHAKVQNKLITLQFNEISSGLLWVPQYLENSPPAVEFVFAYGWWVDGDEHVENLGARALSFASGINDILIISICHPE